MKLVIPVVFFGTILVACSSTRITDSWQAPQVSPPAFKKIVVVGLVGEDEKLIRPLMEQHMIGDLKELGYDAVCSCEEFRPEYLRGLNEKEIIEKMSKEKVDGILTIVLLDKKKEKVYVPEREINKNIFWDYYNNTFDRVYSKGYYMENTRYQWESKLYDLDSKVLLSSIRSQSFDPASTESLAHEYGKLIVRNMVKGGVLTKQVDPSLKPM